MKLRNGIWMSDFRLSNGERVRVSLKTRDKAEAKAKEVALNAQMEGSLAASASVAPNQPLDASGWVPCGITLRDAFRRALREYEPWRASTSQATLLGNYKFVSTHFGENTDLAYFSRPVMLEYVAVLREEMASPSTINQRLSLVSVLLREAEDWTKGRVSPFKMPRQTIRNGRIRTLSYAEEADVVAWFRSPERVRRPLAGDMADFVEFLVDTGFRLSEGLRLETREIQWESNLVPAWETKADHPRLVPMTSKVRAILEGRRHLEFPFGMFSKDSAGDYWEVMRVGLGIDTQKDPEFVIHALRHTCASRLVASGMDAFRVQKWMGHKTIATTQKYVTLFAPDLMALAGALDKRRFELSKSVPKSVPKDGIIHPAADPPRAGRSPPKARPHQAFRRMNRTDGPVVDRLLIRRSLVRAQVEEPTNNRGAIPAESPLSVAQNDRQDCRDTYRNGLPIHVRYCILLSLPAPSSEG